MQSAVDAIDKEVIENVIAYLRFQINIIFLARINSC